MSGLQEDYGRAYFCIGSTPRPAPTNFRQARYYIRLIHYILSSRPALAPGETLWWEIADYQPGDVALNTHLLLKNVSHGQNRWLRLSEDFGPTGTTPLNQYPFIYCQMSDIGPPTSINDWTIWSQPTQWPDSFKMLAMNMHALRVGNLGYPWDSGRLYLVEYVDALGFVVEKSNAYFWDGAVMGRVVHTLNKSDQQHWNGRSTIVGTPPDGLYEGGFNGEGIIAGYARNDLAPGWLAGNAFNGINRNYIRVRPPVGWGLTPKVYGTQGEWVKFHAKYPLANEVAGNSNLTGQGNNVLMIDSRIPITSKWHSTTNGAARILPYPVVTVQPSPGTPASNVNPPESLLGFTRYHRSLPVQLAHASNLKSKDVDSQQSWFAYRGYTNPIIQSNDPVRTNTALLWNKNDTIIIPSPPAGSLGPL